MAKSRKTPRMILYILVSILKVPPRKAKGMDVRMKGQRSFSLKCPFLVKVIKAMDETKMFNIRAAGLIISGAKPSKAIKAR
jgi:hypothetical protein